MFECKFCGHRFQTVNQYVQHCGLHSNASKPRFPCCFTECRKTTSTYDGLRMHISREHGNGRSHETNAKFHPSGVSLLCGVASCSESCYDASSLIKHMQKHIKDGMSVTCPIKYCNKTYRIKSSFSGHLSRDHTNWTLSDLKGDTSLLSSTSNSTLTLLPVADNLSVGNDVADDTVELDELSLQQPLDLKEMFTKNLSLFFVKLMAEHLIPESVVDVIACELKNVNATNQQYLDQNILFTLKSCGASNECIESVMKSVRDSDLIKCCLDDGGILNSSHKRSMFIQRQFHYVDPEQIYVGVNNKNKARYCHYIPVKKTLLTLLSDASVLRQCLNTRFTGGDILSDFTDGSVYKHCVASLDAAVKCLSLILYQDAFEIANPLGSARTKYKVLGFYFVLGNLESCNRSAKDHIQLVLLALEKDVEKVGQRIFRRLVDDLRELETVGLEASGYRFKVVVPAIAGDNLGSHWLGGFTTNFSSGPHSCRYCTITKEQLHKGQFSATGIQLRTVASYNEALRKLDAEDLDVHDGVRFNSIFNNLASFHVCNPGLPPCVAHDLFEGVVSYDIPLFLKALLKEHSGPNHLNKLSLSLLNNRLQCFTFFGSDVLVRPPPLQKSLKRLSGSATQNWCLLRIIPLLISDLINVESHVYQALLLLRSVCELIMAPSISLGQVAEMKVLIEDYVERRHCLFPEVRIRPKHHYLTHYAQLTLQFGPLVKLWTMRFEAKHQYFKRCIRSSKNFLNVTSLLAKRHQLYQAYLSSAERFASDVVVSSADIVIESEIMNEVKCVLIAAGVQPGQVFSSAVINGTVYRTGLVLPFITCHSKKTIVFGEILAVVSQDCGCKLVVGCRNALLDFETGCYDLDEMHDVTILALQSFADYHPLPVYTYKGRPVVVLHHQLADSE